MMRRVSTAFPSTPCLRTGRVLLAAASIALLVVAAPRSAGAKAEIKNVFSLRTVYVENADASWFRNWFDEMSKVNGALFRPDIQITTEDQMISRVIADPQSVGLIGRSSVGPGIDDARQVSIIETGRSVCAALAVPGNATTRHVGDLALLPAGTQVSATRETAGILKDLLNAYHLTGRITVNETSIGEVMNSVSTGSAALAAIPVESGGRIGFEEVAETPRFLDLSDAAMAALLKNGYAAGQISSGLLQRIPYYPKIEAVCDDVMIITADEDRILSKRPIESKELMPQVDAEQAGLLGRTMRAIFDLHEILSSEE